MIVEPDFLDHWKTRLLVRLLGTESAPIYVLRLWAHCQARKTDRFTGWKPDVLASVCRWDGDSKLLWDSMLQTFTKLDGDALIAHDWAECNASLISAWTNGKLGGRPKGSKGKKNRPVNQRETDGVSDREDGEEGLDREDGEENTRWHLMFGIEIPENLQTEECLEAARLWLKYKSERRDGYKRTGLKAALKKWSREFDSETFPAAVENSMAQNYSGVFPPRTSNAYQPTLIGTNTPSDAPF
jgi:hypothetical protein